MAASAVDIGTLIVATPGIVGGLPRIAGTRVSVKHIADCLNNGLSPQQMVERFPTIDLTGAYAAITYYLANQAEIDRDTAEEEAEVARFIDQRTGPATPRG